MSAPTLPTLTPAETLTGADDNIATEIADLVATGTAVLARLHRNRFGQWCTLDCYGAEQPHSSYDAAMSVIDADEIG